MAQATLSCHSAAIHLVAPDEAAAAEHNGDIWSRPPTKYVTLLTGKNQRFLLGVSIIGIMDTKKLRQKSNCL